MKIVVTGASGLLGSRLLHILSKKHNVIGTYFKNKQNNSIKLDLNNASDTYNTISAINPDIVIHCAYKTENPEQNVYNMTKNIYTASKNISAKFVFLSTDLVFDGEQGNYAETSIPTPITEYGKWKYKAEGLIDTNPDIIVRTSLIYSRHTAASHEKFIIRNLKNNEKVPLFYDSFRCPILDDDLSLCIAKLIDIDFSGIMHIAGPQKISRYDFALFLAKWRNYDTRLFDPISVTHSKNHIPKDCSLNITKFTKTCGIMPRSVTEVFNNV